MKLIPLLFLSVLSICYVSAQNVDTLTNEKLIKLFKAGFGKDVLKSKIQSTPSKFDVSIDGLIGLKKVGIPEDVINMMVAKPEQIHNSETLNENQNFEAKGINLESGIYYKTPQSEYLEIDPSILTATKSNNAAQLFVSGLINSKLKISISGQHSSFKIKETTPTFAFVFDATVKKNLNDDNNQFFSNARSPKEFILVRLDVNIKSRDLTVGKSNAISENSGIDDKSIIQFTTKKISNGFYEITPEKTLKSGEYGIMFSQGIKKGESSKIFDFTISE